VELVYLDSLLVVLVVVVLHPLGPLHLALLVVLAVLVYQIALLVLPSLGLLAARAEMQAVMLLGLAVQQIQEMVERGLTPTQAAAYRLSSVEMVDREWLFLAIQQQSLLH
jgi:hypothetical protein